MALGEEYIYKIYKKHLKVNLETSSSVSNSLISVLQGQKQPWLL